MRTGWGRFFRRRHLDLEIERDLEFYLAAETDDNIARGMTPQAARAAAQRKLGNPGLIREEVYRMNTVGFLESIWLDLRYAARNLRQSPAFTLTAVLSLALGIGGNTAVFTVVRGVLLKPLAYGDPSRLVKISQSDPDGPNNVTVDFTTTSDLRSRTRTLQSLSLFRFTSGATAGAGEPEVIQGLRVNYDYFDTLGVRMAMGRGFLPGEDTPQTRREVILTHNLWMRRYGGDPQILGRSIRITDASFVVVGVLPRDFRPLALGYVVPEMYTPLGYALGQPAACRGCQHLQLIGRLKPGVTVEQARADLKAIMRDIKREHPKDYAPSDTILVTPLRDFLVQGVDRAMWVLLGAVVLVLLIACANVANLVLARATVRAREMALRSALGAARLRLVRQLLLESLLLAAAGTALGLVLAQATTSALVVYAARQLPRSGEIRVDGMVLWFTAAAGLVTLTLAGLVPALRTSRVDLAEALKDAGRSTEGGSRSTLRGILVSAELALAFTLVMGAGLLGRSFLRLTHVDPGYDPHRVLTLATYVYGDRYQKPAVELAYYRQVLDRIRAIPGVEGAAMVSTLPLASFDRRGFHRQDRPLANESSAPSADTYSVSPDYLRVMRIPLKRGRWFDAGDHAGTPAVAVISESCAQSQFRGEDPLGKHIQLGGRHDDREWLTIVGIVGDVRQYGLDRPSSMEAYVAQEQDVSFGYNLVARTSGDPKRFEKAISAAFYAVDPALPVYQVMPLESYLFDTLAARAFTLVLLAVFGVLSLTLAAIGIYGVVSYAVSLRTREVGIRMALGAGKGAVLSLVLRQGLVLAGTGIACGFGASILLTRFLAALLFEVQPVDPLTSLATAGGLALLAVCATCVPALRAARIDPAGALRA